MTLLDLVKLDLHIAADDTYHDARLEMYIAEATDEALRFMGLFELPAPDSNAEVSSDGLDIAPSVAGGIRLLVRGKFEAAEASDIERIRRDAETLLTPYRERWGV